jgi:hypothetical protein
MCLKTVSLMSCQYVPQNCQSNELPVCSSKLSAYWAASMCLKTVSLLSCQYVPQNCQPSGSPKGKNWPPKDRVKLTGLITHMNMLKCLQFQCTVHWVKNMCIHLLINCNVPCISYFHSKTIGCFWPAPLQVCFASDLTPSQQKLWKLGLWEVTPYQLSETKHFLCL